MPFNPDEFLRDPESFFARKTFDPDTFLKDPETYFKEEPKKLPYKEIAKAAISPFMPKMPTRLYEKLTAKEKPEVIPEIRIPYEAPPIAVEKVSEQEDYFRRLGIEIQGITDKAIKVADPYWKKTLAGQNALKKIMKGSQFIGSLMASHAMLPAQIYPLIPEISKFGFGVLMDSALDLAKPEMEKLTPTQQTMYMGMNVGSALASYHAIDKTSKFILGKAFPYLANQLQKAKYRKEVKLEMPKTIDITKQDIIDIYAGKKTSPEIEELAKVLPNWKDIVRRRGGKVVLPARVVTKMKGTPFWKFLNAVAKKEVRDTMSIELKEAAIAGQALPAPEVPPSAVLPGITPELIKPTPPITPPPLEAPPITPPVTPPPIAREIEPPTVTLPRISPIRPPIKPVPAPVPPKKVKPIIHKVVGIKKKPIITTEMQLLKTRLKAEQRAAKLGEKVGRIETRKKIYTQLKYKKANIDEIRKSILKYTSENLTSKDKVKVSLLAEKAKTPKQMNRAMKLINRMEERYQRHIAVDDIKETVKKIDFKRLRPEYKEPITKITDSIDLINRREKTIIGLNKMAEYISRNPDNAIPDKQLMRLTTLSKTPIKKLTTEDINLVNASIQGLVRQHDLKNKLIIKGKIRDAQEIKNKAIENVRKKEQVEVRAREGVITSRAKQFFTTDALNAEHISMRLDGEGKGIIKSVMYDGVDDGVSTTLKIRQDADDFFWEENNFKNIDMSRWSEKFHTRKARKKKVDYFPYKLESGKTLELTKMERIALELHSRNLHSLRHLLEGGIRLESNIPVLYKLTGEDIENIRKTLTEPEKKVANTIHKYFNVNQRKQLNKTSTELNGWEIATEDDYFKIRVHGIDIRRDYLLRGEALPSNMKNFVRSTLEGMGMLKTRISASNPIILEDALSATYKSIKEASTYIGMASPLRNAKALLFDPKFRNETIKNFGEHTWQALNNYIKDVEGDYQRTDNVDRMFTGWINRLDIAILGLNPFVMLKQPISLLAASIEIDSKYLLRALLGKPEKVETMSKYSPQLRDRFEGNVTRELGEIAQVGQVRQFFTHKFTLPKKLMAGIRNFDYQAIGRIWKAVEYETNKLHPTLTGKRKMNHIAKKTEEVVRLTQPTFHLKDRSGIGRNRDTFIRLATKYTSQRNKNYMMLARIIGKYNNSSKTTKDKSEFTKGIATITMLMPLMLYGVDALRNWAYKRPKQKRFIRHRIFRFLDLNLGNVYLVGPLFRSLTSKIERGEFAGYDINDILTSTGEQGINAMANVIRGIEQVTTHERYKAGDKRGQLKWKTSMKRGIDQALGFNLKFRGIPYDTIKKLLGIFKEKK